jgi:hypothetical protein
LRPGDKGRAAGSGPGTPKGAGAQARFRSEYQQFELKMSLGYFISHPSISFITFGQRWHMHTAAH